MSRKHKAIAILIALVLGPILTFCGWREFHNSSKLADEGKAVTAKVVDHEKQFRPKGRRAYYMSVEFQSEDGRAHSKRMRVSRTVYRNAIDAGAVTVHYLASDPSICSAGDRVETKFGMLIVGLAAMVGGGIFIVLYLRPLNDEEMAERVAQDLAPLCPTRHEYVTVDMREFSHLDQSYYDDGRRRLEARGYAHLVDQEDLTISRSGRAARILLRVLVSRDGVSVACLYHFQPRGLMRFLGVKEFKVVDFETQFSDGTFACTTNAEMAGKLDSPAVIDTLCLPSMMPIETVLQAHEQRVAGYLAQCPGVQPVRVGTVEEVRRVQDEMQRLKARHRQDAGLSQKELQRLAGGNAGAEIDPLPAGIQQQHEQHNRKAA